MKFIRILCPSQSSCHNKLLPIIRDYNIKIYATIIKLNDKWITSIEIIDYLTISHYPTYHIFGKSPTFSHFVHLFNYQSIQETKYKIMVTSPPKVSIISHVSQYTKSLIKDS